MPKRNQHKRSNQCTPPLSTQYLHPKWGWVPRTRYPMVTYYAQRVPTTLPALHAILALPKRHKHRVALARKVRRVYRAAMAQRH